MGKSNKFLMSRAIIDFIKMEAATPRGSARDLDPGLSSAREEAKAVPPGKRPQQ